MLGRTKLWLVILLFSSGDTRNVDAMEPQLRTEPHNRMADTVKIKAAVDAQPESFELGDFPLEGGKSLSAAKLVYTIRGTLNTDKSNAILVPSPFDADHTAHDFLFGKGKALDPDIHFIISTNQLGNGNSTSPSNAPAPISGTDFPPLVIRDDVEATYRLVTEKFGIKKLKAVVGFSMGGQQSLQWGVSHPNSMKGIVAICSTAREHPFGVVRLEGAKGAIMGDTAFNQGRYTKPPVGGLQALGLHWVAWAYSPEWWRRGEYQTALGLHIRCRGRSLEEFFRRR